MQFNIWLTDGGVTSLNMALDRYCPPLKLASILYRPALILVSHGSPCGARLSPWLVLGSRQDNSAKGRAASGVQVTFRGTMGGLVKRMTTVVDRKSTRLNSSHTD